MSRTVCIIPIVHTETDLGQLAASVKQLTSDDAWANKQSAVAKLWSEIERWVHSIDASDLYVYQDGLPAADAAASIVSDLTAQGSLNHKLIASLTARGATLVGTEDPALLLKEYELATNAADAIAAGRPQDPRHAQRSRTILERRDSFIAARIDQTLPQNRRGMLFIGMLHDVESKLPGDIEPIYPLGRSQYVPGATR
ncbi:MAG: hypothetical protein AAF108_06580 [Planctomycetota bacterium]